MNRFKSRCDLSFRTRHKGGPALARDNLPGSSLKARDRFVFLIHGYNVSDDAAVTAFEYFRARMRRDCRDVEKDVLTIAWPGDGRWPFSTMSYPWRVRTAVSLAPALAKVIEENVRGRNNGECELILIGHSLGCRFILEALHELGNSKKTLSIKKLLVFLMAPAVPVGMVDTSGPLGKTVNDEFYKIGVLYSPHDSVLSGPFRIGQTAARRFPKPARGRNEGFFPEAVGFLGGPEKTWDKPKLAHGYDHGEYWYERNSAKYLASFLERPTHREVEYRPSVRFRRLYRRLAPQHRRTAARWGI